MKLIDKIKETIFKVKDYDRLESDYCTVLDIATGGILSKPNYTIDSVREAINDYLNQRDKEIKKELKRPAQQVQKILNSIGEDATWLVVSVFCNGRGWSLFRNGRKIEEEDLTEREREWLESWIFAMCNGGGLFKKGKRK